jgi:hypothetical protein
MIPTTIALTKKPIKVPACSCQNVRTADPPLALKTGSTPSTTQNACSTLRSRVSRTAKPSANPERTALTLQFERSVGRMGFAVTRRELAPSPVALLFSSGIQIKNYAGCAMMPAISQPARYRNTERAGAGTATASMNAKSNALRIAAMRPLASGGTSDRNPTAIAPLTASQTLAEARVPRLNMIAPKAVSIAD